MILLVVGILFIALGLFSGAVLVAAPFGLVPLGPGLSLWVFFPVFSILGSVLVILGAKTAHIRVVSLAVSCILLILAAASAVGLVVSAVSAASTPPNTSSLWFVLVVAGILGTVGAASYRSDDGAAGASA